MSDNKHQCNAPYVYDDDGVFWVANGEYATPVVFLPSVRPKGNNSSTIGRIMTTEQILAENILAVRSVRRLVGRGLGPRVVDTLARHDKGLTSREIGTALRLPDVARHALGFTLLTLERNEMIRRNESDDRFVLARPQKSLNWLAAWTSASPRARQLGRRF